MASRAIENSRNEVKIEKLDDKVAINKYGVKNIPGFVINEELVSQCKVLTERKIGKFIM